MDARVFAQTAGYGNSDAINIAVERLFEQVPAAGGLGAQSRVLIKPNLLSKNPPEAAVTTHPDVLRAVILALKRRGVGRITVADSPGGPWSAGAMRGIYESCGVAAVCAETGAEAWVGSEGVETACGGKLVRQFTLLRPVAEADFIINLPKLKTHVLMVMSGAVKNLFGLVPGLQKAEFHMRFPERADFASMLVDLCETVQPSMTIVDGVLAMEGDGPGSGTPRVCNLLLGGEDPYSIDLTICHYMRLDGMSVPFLAEAHRRGLCAERFDPALLLGEAPATAPFEGFIPPRSYSGRVDFGSNLPGFLRPLMPAIARWASPKPVISKPACIGCGKCAEICPQKVIAIDNRKAKISPKNCIHCFCCHEICPVHAIGVRRNPLFKL
ncbi:DUF362 domain-containing protein [Ruminococcaceae bacterium OttesenSCG-928-D13]|nr:DUF362 domain-containing protein [Ruminococcaceae bacterium OttesenSCG-928-D13]